MKIMKGISVPLVSASLSGGASMKSAGLKEKRMPAKTAGILWDY